MLYQTSRHLIGQTDRSNSGWGRVGYKYVWNYNLTWICMCLFVLISLSIPLSTHPSTLSHIISSDRILSSCFIQPYRFFSRCHQLQAAPWYSIMAVPVCWSFNINAPACLCNLCNLHYLDRLIWSSVWWHSFMLPYAAYPHIYAAHTAYSMGKILSESIRPICLHTCLSRSFN